MDNVVYRVNFTEHERGWGFRPDGYLLAKSLEIALAESKRIDGLGTADEYVTADGPPYLFVTTPENYKAVEESPKGFVHFWR